MEPTTDGLRREMALLLEQLKTTRDELRVKMHLGGMEAKDAWRDLQPELDQALEAAKRVSAESVARVSKVLQRMHLLGQDLERHPRPPA